MEIISLQSIIPVKPEYNFFQSGGYFSFIIFGLLHVQIRPIESELDLTE